MSQMSLNQKQNGREFCQPKLSKRLSIWEFSSQLYSTIKTFIGAFSSFNREHINFARLANDTIYRIYVDKFNFEYMSDSICKITGYTATELKFMDFFELIAEARIIRDKIQHLVDYQTIKKVRLANLHRKWEADYYIKTKFGEYIWVSDICYPWYDSEGEIIGAIGCIKESNDRVKAELALEKDLQQLAFTDELTHLANRRYFFEYLEKELKTQDDPQQETAILLIDIDYFKTINDNYGHLTGDDVLVIISSIIKSCLHETDLAARLGGEEFGVCLPHTSQRSAYWVAERICKAVGDYDFVLPNKAGSFKCTVSIGIAVAKNNGKSEMHDLISIADTRLYIAKNTGKNQISMDEVVALH